MNKTNATTLNLKITIENKPVCKRCKGSGKIITIDLYGRENLAFWCPGCRGKGY